MKKIYLYTIFALFLLSSEVSGQVEYIYTNGKELTVLGRTTTDTSNYHRVNATDAQNLPARVQELSKYAAGINLIFQTNSKSIAVNWKLERLNSLWHMSSLGVNGLDLYGWNGKSWQFISSARPSGINNKAVFINGLDGEFRHYRIFFPLYAEVKNIEIGILKGAKIKAASKPYIPTKKIAIYGSSITQGIAASRPGMAYPSILSRKLNVETVNLGFSGSGKMEIEIADVLSKIAADVYILDCVPNALPQEIKDRAYPLITKLRQLKPNTPIIMMESVNREGGNWNSIIKNRVSQQNEEFRKTYTKLSLEGQRNIYYINSDDLMGNDHEATVDGTHLTDLGFMRISDAIIKELVRIKL